METRKNRELFVKEMNDRIELRNTILDFYTNVFIPMLCLKFNGKVLNKRFINALNKEAEKFPHMYVKEEYTYGEITISMRKDYMSYTDVESLYIKLRYNEEGRLDYDATINDQYSVAWLKSFKNGIDEYRDVIKNYDTYMSVADKLEGALKEYNKLPHKFRGNLRTDYMRIY